MTNWQALTAAQKQEAVREALETSHLTYKRAAERLGTTVGAIAAAVRDSGGAPAGRIRSARTAPPRSNVKRAPVPKAVKEVVAPFGEAVIAPDTRPTYARAWDALPDSTPVPLWALTEHQCKWSVGDKTPHMFCALPTAGGPWCEAHNTMAWRPLKSDKGPVKSASRTVGSWRRV